MTSRSVEFLKKYPIAHRGYFNNAGEHPENSLGAIVEAVANGFASELDVMLSADGQVMVFHDDSLERMCGRQEMFSQLSAQQLAAIPLKNSQECIPTLAKVLDSVRGMRPLVIELKSFNRNGMQSDGKLEDAVVRVLEGYLGEVALKSFNPFSVKELLRLRQPHHSWPVGFISCNHSKDADFAFLTEAQSNGLSQLTPGVSPECEFISYNINDLSEELSHQVRRNKPLMVWTVRTEEQFLKAQRLADNIVFEWRGVKPSRNPYSQA
ncbi:phosphodiesterase [bacterium]|nr:phosphodiesterase [bacterium]